MSDVTTTDKVLKGMEHLRLAGGAAILLITAFNLSGAVINEHCEECDIPRFDQAVGLEPIAVESLER